MSKKHGHMTNQKELKPIGQIHFGDVNEASICYTLKYIQKPKTIKKNDKTGRTPEFSLMSKGIGSQYLRSSVVDWHKIQETTRVYVSLDGNKKGAMPRYYKDKIYDSESKRKIAIKRSSDLSAQARKVRDVFKYQHDLDQSINAAYRRMHSKTTKNKI